MSTRVLLVTGTLGVGKTEVVREINEVLRRRGVSNATIDLDWLGKGRPPHTAERPPPAYGTYSADLIIDNLAAIWPNYARRGIDRLLLARVIEQPAELDGYRVAIRDADLVVCRLLAPPEVIQARIARRELGLARTFLAELAVTVEAHLNEIAVEDFTVVNDGTSSLTSVADAVLDQCGW